MNAGQGTVPAQGPGRKGLIVAKYWIDIAGCQRVIADLREIVDTEQEFQWVRSDLLQVDRNSYAAEESSLTERDAEKLDQRYYEFYEDKLEPTYDSMMRELKNCIDTMEEVVNYYVSGDAAMAYEASSTDAEFPEYRSSDGSSTAQYPVPSPPSNEPGPSEPTPSSPQPSYPDPNNPLGDDHYIVTPYSTTRPGKG